MSRRIILVVVAILGILAIVAWTLGWFVADTPDPPPGTEIEEITPELDEEIDPTEN